MAILSKKLATINTNVPVEFHEEDFRLKDWNKEKLKEVFAELEFRTLGKRLLGEDFSVGSFRKISCRKRNTPGSANGLVWKYYRESGVSSRPTGPCGGVSSRPPKVQALRRSPPSGEM